LQEFSAVQDRDDAELTRRLAAAGALMGIDVDRGQWLA
jgi:hypothetical protein